MSVMAMVIFLRNEDGNFTIEATLIFPVVFLLTIALIFLSMWAFENVSIQQIAVLTADRIAGNWDNSHKDAETGAFDINENDGLYWRTGSDLLGDLVHSFSNDSTVIINIPGDPLKAYPFGPALKLHNGSRNVPQGITGKLVYSDHMFIRKITVQLAYFKIPLKNLMAWFGNMSVIQGESSAFVSDPVEFIRNIDFISNEMPILKDLITVNGTQQTSSVTVSPPYKAPEIHSETEASRYVQQLVHGHTIVIPTGKIGKSRKIDALDADGIAHEAKYTVNNKEARQEIQKDLELEREGIVKGVVWHFFRNVKTGKVELTESLRQDLERSGIVIVIHN